MGAGSIAAEKLSNIGDMRQSNVSGKPLYGQKADMKAWIEERVKAEEIQRTSVYSSLLNLGLAGKEEDRIVVREDTG